MRTVWKHRAGQWYSKKAADYRRGRYSCGRPIGQVARDPLCPLCGELDGSTHLLLQCKHRAIKAMQIGRHNQAGRLIQRSLQRCSALGSAYTVLDVCGRAQLEENDAAATRIPAWVLPNVDEGTRAIMRPDILRIIGLPPAPTAEDIQRARRLQRHRRIQIVEIGYTMDTRWRQAYAEKEKQHKQLIEHLHAAGWKVDGHIIILGACGAVYASGQRALQELGLSKCHTRELLTELSCMAVQAAHNITCARRRIEAARQGVG